MAVQLQTQLSTETDLASRLATGGCKGIVMYSNRRYRPAGTNDSLGPASVLLRLLHTAAVALQLWRSTLSGQVHARAYCLPTGSSVWMERMRSECFYQLPVAVLLLFLRASTDLTDPHLVLLCRQLSFFLIAAERCTQHEQLKEQQGKSEPLFLVYRVSEQMRCVRLQAAHAASAQQAGCDQTCLLANICCLSCWQSE